MNNSLIELHKKILDLNLYILKNSDTFFVQNNNYIKEKHRNIKSFTENLEYLATIVYYLNQQIKNTLENSDDKIRSIFENRIISILFDNLISKTSRLLNKFEEHILNGFELYVIEYRNITIEHIDEYSIPQLDINSVSISYENINFDKNHSFQFYESNIEIFEELIYFINQYRDPNRKNNCRYYIYEGLSDEESKENFTEENIINFIDQLCLQHFKEIKDSIYKKEKKPKDRYNAYKRFKDLLTNFPIPGPSFQGLLNILNNKIDLLLEH